MSKNLMTQEQAEGDDEVEDEAELNLEKVSTLKSVFLSLNMLKCLLLAMFKSRYWQKKYSKTFMIIVRLMVTYFKRNVDFIARPYPRKVLIGDLIDG